MALNWAAPNGTQLGCTKRKNLLKARIFLLFLDNVFMLLADPHEEAQR
jgi:hypothetical protein